VVTALPAQPTSGQNPWYATMKAWMDGVALNINELNADTTNHIASTVHIPTGGTVGQVLKKNSSTNYDASWQNESGGGGGSITAPATLTGTDANTVPFTINGATGQSSSFMEVKKDDGTVHFAVQNTGEVRLGPSAPTLSAALKIQGNDGTRRGIVFKSSSGTTQTASLMELLDSSGNVLFKVAADGVVTAPNVSSGVIVLGANDAIPNGTPTGTVILRRP